jgi:hypothetical protein
MLHFLIASLIGLPNFYKNIEEGPHKPDLVLRQAKASYTIYRHYWSFEADGTKHFNSDKICSGSAMIDVIQFQEMHSSTRPSNHPPISCLSKLKNHAEKEAKSVVVKLDPTIMIFPAGIMNADLSSKVFDTMLSFYYSDSGYQARNHANSVAEVTELGLKNLNTEILSEDTILSSDRDAGDFFQATMKLEDSQASADDGILNP